MQRAGRAHCRVHHATPAGVTCDWTCRSQIRKQVTGQVTRGEKSDDRVGGAGNDAQTSQYGVHKAGSLMIITPVLYTALNC